ncbi:hypothetical protein P175DRAFT_0536467 [Aspergillus ochraceoroseus IBT 24754]|nr:uncharacterized protein P175DRAFT_0536467 [Aspergillus ochraceoroseus IBT 24754]KKK15249.1 hypothetical protein AOCH_000373 [Aspergillus ochraceoroseus]PTU16878.1 hypothetical protein P175DRAFT_0536467 [Aspergillus ochraceoroseus IBT 24754]
MRSPSRGQLSMYPPGGAGRIEVTVNGDLSTSGCLNVDGAWTVNTGNCAAVFGNGQGGISTENGWLILDEDSNITTTTTTWSTAWVGTHTNQDRTAHYLQANVGNTGGEPWGGQLWFSDQAPEGDAVVTLNGKHIHAPVHVILTFASTAGDS